MKMFLLIPPKLYIVYTRTSKETEKSIAGYTRARDNYPLLSKCGAHARKLIASHSKVCQLREIYTRRSRLMNLFCKVEPKREFRARLSPLGALFAPPRTIYIFVSQEREDLKKEVDIPTGRKQNCRKAVARVYARRHAAHPGATRISS